MINFNRDDIATCMWRDKEREIAGKEQTRLMKAAKAARYAKGSVDRVDLAVVASAPRPSAIRSLAGTWRSLGQVVVSFVTRHVPA